MRYLIDSANQQEIDLSLKLGAAGITANPSLYLKEKINFYEFIRRYSDRGILLTAEIIGQDNQDMMRQLELITEISNDVVIKLNYSAENLYFARTLKQKGVTFAFTLIFDINQAMMAIGAGADYLFLFVSRNEELGIDGLEFIRKVSEIIGSKGYKTKVIAASIRTKYQVECAALYADYIAVPFKFIEGSFHHPLTISGSKQFESDMQRVLGAGEALMN
ncbi:transaldolase family protein [Neobacillus drentensis]|uniref:transaldolase family protein n=1 Tax=Neobacillus drentensis TaxID=220684 RepID=UPI002FFF9F04